jgi:Ni/Co efflux regulator RcnB
MLKKVVLSTLTLTMLGVPLAQAKDNHPVHKPTTHKVEPNKPTPKSHWSKGQRYGDWRRHQEVRDYKRYGLRKPGAGQHWVKVDNQYLLITAATGLVAGALAAR